ncbi:MAG: hypothetical protein NTU62_09370 [Spirochaetes bacterium]|nr:hypothetical protein [Spirochaetota bacterium]
MFGFLVKKTFFDMWDNMFRIILLNLAFLALMGMIALPSLLSGDVPADAAAASGSASVSAQSSVQKAPAAPLSDAEMEADFNTFLSECAAKPFSAPLARILLMLGPVRGSQLIGMLIARQPLIVLPLVILLIGVAALAALCGVASRMTSEIADYKQPGFADFLASLKESWANSLLGAGLLAGYLFVVSIAFPFYAGKGVVGWLAMGLLFWVTVAALLAVQYFFPIQSRLDRKFRKIVRKSFLLLFDNTIFSFGLLAVALIIFGVSAFTAFLLPGISTIFLWWNAALKLRLYKYDWLEQNPGADRRKVPWDALLIDDRERVGKRTLKGMIFPWKE